MLNVKLNPWEIVSCQKLDSEWEHSNQPLFHTPHQLSFISPLRFSLCLESVAFEMKCSLLSKCIYFYLQLYQERFCLYYTQHKTQHMGYHLSIN